jgi:GT2 family glycosyltransferase
MSRGISVIIPNYNGRHLLPEILPPAFEAVQNTGLPYEIIVSDDHSGDDSVYFLKEHFPSVIIIENDINKGFSPTINAAIKRAQFDHLLLLNSDVKLTREYFRPLFRYFERDDTFGVMGRIIGWNDDHIQDGGKYPGYHGAKIKTSGNYVPVEPTSGDWLYSMYLSGANAFVSREKLVELGGFDEIFAPFYVEDFELSLRAWRLGYKWYYEHNAVCRHKVSVSIKKMKKKNFINTIYYRNKMYLHAMHLKGSKLVLWYAQLIPEALIRVLTLRFYYLKSLMMFFRNRPLWLRSMKKFNLLMKEKKSSLSVEDVVEKIHKTLNPKNIIRF